MKAKRQAQILELINNHAIDTQEELLTKLNECGYKVTQATVSRDIKELRLTKSLSQDGKYRYTAVAVGGTNNRSDFRSFFNNSVLSVNCAENIIVIKTMPGMAQGICASLDMMNHNELLGTIAGDDTIFAVSKNSEIAVNFTNELRKLL